MPVHGEEVGEKRRREEKKKRNNLKIIKQSYRV